MIFTDRKITIRNGKSSIDAPVVLYRGDFEVSIRFTIMESKFRFKSGVNLVDSEKASFGQLAILAPYGGNVFSEVVKCEDGTVTFTLTKEMIDQLEEVGLYSFQIRLFDYYRESRVSIPPVEFGIEVREPVASEDHDNEVNNAIVGYSIAKVVDGLNEDVPDTFDANGNYNKTDWETGDRITEGKLNKIEDALDKINQNEISNKQALGKQMTSNYLVLDNKIEEVATKGTTATTVESTTRNVINDMMQNGTMGSLTIADNSIGTSKINSNLLGVLSNGKMTFNDPDMFLKFTGAYKPNKKTWAEKIEENPKRHKLIEMIPVVPNSFVRISIADGYQWDALYFADIINNSILDSGWNSGSRVIHMGTTTKYIGLSIRKADNSEFTIDDEIIEASLTVEYRDYKVDELSLKTNYNENYIVDINSITFDEKRGNYGSVGTNWYEDGGAHVGRIRIHDPFYIDYGEVLYVYFNDSTHEVAYTTYTMPTDHATSVRFLSSWHTKSPLILPNNDESKRELQVGICFRDKFAPSSTLDLNRFYKGINLKIIIKPAINGTINMIDDVNDNIQEMMFRYKCHTTGVNLSDIECIPNTGLYKFSGYPDLDQEVGATTRIRSMRSLFIPKGYEVYITCPNTTEYQYVVRIYDYDNLPDVTPFDSGWKSDNEYIPAHKYEGNTLCVIGFRRSDNTVINFDDFLTNFDINLRVKRKDEEIYENNDYEEEQLAILIDKIQNKERYDFIAPFITDTHYTKTLYPNDNIDHMKTVVKLTKESLIDCVLHGGDVCWDYFNIDTFKSYMREASNVLHESNCAVLVAPGNHDVGHKYYASATDKSPIWNYEQFNKTMNGNKGIVHGPDGTYYKDFEEQKLRIIVVNCHDAQVVDENGKLKYNTSEGGGVVYAIRQNQMQFIGESLKCKDGWRIFIMSHASLLDGVKSNLQQPTNAPILLTLINARKNNSSITQDIDNGDFSININFDYTNSGVVDIIGCAYGHTHYDSMYTYDDVTHIGVTNSSGNHSNLLSNAKNACTFDVLCMNFEERRVDVFRYGTTIGADRSFTY